MRFRPDGGLLLFGFRPKRSNQEKCDPMSAPNHRFAMIRSPALRSRSGVRRQAIPGLTLDASASMHRPAPNRRGPMSLGLCGARRSQTGERQQRKTKSKARGPTHGAQPRHGVQFSRQIMSLKIERPQFQRIKQYQGVTVWIVVLDRSGVPILFGLISVRCFHAWQAIRPQASLQRT